MAFSAPLGCVRGKRECCQHGFLSTPTREREAVCLAAKKGSKASYTELDGDRKEVGACLLGNDVTAGDAGKVDVAGFDQALGALGGPEELLGKSTYKLFSSESGPEREKAILYAQRQAGRGGKGGVLFTGNQRRPCSGWRSRDRPWP